jgi:hypothetical protein
VISEVRKRYRNNPIDIESWLPVAAVGVGIYFLYTALQNFFGKTGAGGAAINSAAQAYVNLTSGGAIVPTGNVVLPDGNSIPVSSINMNASTGANFTYNGANYSIQSGTDSNGNWTAVPTCG